MAIEKISFPNGDVYEGETAGGMPHGKGKAVFANGDVYEGDFVSGKYHGMGTYISADGKVRAGEWENNKHTADGGALSQDAIDELLSGVDPAADIVKKIPVHGNNKDLKNAEPPKSETEHIKTAYANALNDGGIPKEDIDLLLTAIDIRQKKEEEEKEEINKFYSDDYPHKCTKEQMKSIYKIHEKFIPLAVKSVSDKLGSPVNISIAAIDQLTINDLIRSIPNPTALYIFSMKPLNGIAVMEIYFPVPADITSHLMDNLREAWAEVIDIQFAVEKTETNPGSINIAPKAEGIVLITLEIKNSDSSGMINIIFPYSVIKQILEKL